MKKRTSMLLFFVIVLSFFVGRYSLQRSITLNYQHREIGILPDKWHWADVIYYRLGGDYSFYTPAKSPADLLEENPGCAEWAFGEDWLRQERSNGFKIWNKRHGDIFIIEPTDYILDSVKRIINECNKLPSKTD